MKAVEEIIFLITDCIIAKTDNMKYYKKKTYIINKIDVEF